MNTEQTDIYWIVGTYEELNTCVLMGFGYLCHLL
jgi:hypothetical protein